MKKSANETFGYARENNKSHFQYTMRLGEFSENLVKNYLKNEFIYENAKSFDNGYHLCDGLIIARNTFRINGYDVKAKYPINHFGIEHLLVGIKSIEHYTKLFEANNMQYFAIFWLNLNDDTLYATTLKNALKREKIGKVQYPSTDLDPTREVYSIPIMNFKKIYQLTENEIIELNKIKALKNQKLC